MAQLILCIIRWSTEPGKLMIWQNYCLETLCKQHVSQMEILMTFCIALFRFFPTSKICFIFLREHKWTLEHLSHQEASFLGQALTCGCVHVENFWLSLKIFVEGEQNPLHFEYVSSFLCYNNACLLLVLGSDATLLVNLQTGVIPCIMRYQSQHPEKKLCLPSNGHSALRLYNNSACSMC